MKKVMHVIHDLSTGGAETLVKDYALLINKNSFDFSIVCFFRRNFPYEKLLKENNINVIYLSDYIKTSGNNVISRIIIAIMLLFTLKKVIHKEKPDIIHTHLSINTLIRFAKPKKGTKIFHTVHNEPTIMWRKNIIRQVDKKSAKWLVKNYNMRFIALHDKMREEINDMFGVDNSIVLNNGIDFSRFDDQFIKNKDAFRDELNIPKDAFVVGHIGRFMNQKNHEMLVDIFDEIHKLKNNAFLLMIGTGELRERVEEKLKEKGLEKDYLILSNRSDIPDLLNIMDCFVFPSKFEGLPVTLIEAQKMKLPCFVSDKINDYSFISNLITVMSLELSPEQWAKNIVEYKLPKDIILKAEEWDMKNVIKKLENIYMDNV